MTRREGPDAVALVGGVEAGNEPVPSALLTVTDTINGGKAALYSDEFLTTPVANPITCDGSGRFSVYVRPGTYSFTVPAGADAMENVQIGSLASAPGAVPSRLLPAARAVATSNITLSAPQTVDGVALVAGDRVLAVGQSTGSQNGPWVVQAAAFTRPADFVSGTTQPAGLLIPVAAGGTVNVNGSVWQMSNSAAVVVDTGSPTFVNVGGGNARTITSASANALAVGPNGTTNPTFNVDDSTASAATGLNVKSAAAAAGLAVTVLSSGTDENLTVDAKGAGTITLNGTATGGVTTPRSLKTSSPTGGLGYGTGAGGAVTQITTSATGVLLSKACGQITTVALTTAAGAEERFTVTNTVVAITDVIALSTTYNGAGTVALSVQNVTAGTFDIVITNLHASNAFNALMVINFVVLKAVAA